MLYYLLTFSNNFIPASPLPYFENVTLAQQKSEPPMTPSISTAPPAAPPTPTISTTPITNIVPNVSKEDHDRWVAAWNSCAPTAGTISGDKARDLFMKSGLGVDVLGKIWLVHFSMISQSKNKYHHLTNSILLSYYSGQSLIPQMLGN